MPRNTPRPIEYANEADITADEYIAFLAETDLGTEYPKKRFRERIETLLRNADVRISARNPEGVLVGVCLGVTDFAYFLFITDLGIHRSHVRRGIGRALVGLAHERAGGPDDISMITWANRQVLPFYASCGMTPVEHAVAAHARDWELFTVSSASP